MVKDYWLLPFLQIIDNIYKQAELALNLYTDYFTEWNTNWNYYNFIIRLLEQNFLESRFLKNINFL